mmetsp:Transcript_28818/g.52712  ORF Transcript_28818/g.52712 Transcript_28818/m.52712 type:complete len:101 (-) Transcript_28818:324-626(-)
MRSPRRIKEGTLNKFAIQELGSLLLLSRVQHIVSCKHMIPLLRKIFSTFRLLDIFIFVYRTKIYLRRMQNVLSTLSFLTFFHLSKSLTALSTFFNTPSIS